jgi:hypothetical protein
MKKTGRPPLDHDDETVPVTVKMPSRLYDATLARAHEDRVGLPERIRRDLAAAAAGQKRFPK